MKILKSLFLFAALLTGPAWATTVATDDFNRIDAANPGTNWATGGASNFNLRIVSNQIEANNDPSLMAYTNRVADQDGQVGVTVKTLATTSGQGMGPARRVSTTANTGYFVAAYTGGLVIYKVVTDTYTNPCTAYTGTISSNDVIVLKVTGSATSTLTVYQNGVQRISCSDASAITSGRDGMFGSIDGATHPTGDDWYVDDLTGGGASAVAGRAALLGVGK